MDALWKVLLLVAAALVGLAVRWYWERSAAKAVDENEVGALFLDRVGRFTAERERVLRDNPSDVDRLDRKVVAEFTDEYRKLRAAAPSDARLALEFAFRARHQLVASHWTVKNTARERSSAAEEDRATLQRKMDEYRDDLAWVSQYLPEDHELRVDPASAG